MEFKIRCSAIADIMAGQIGLTEKQTERLKELEEREKPGAKPLTLNMQQELIGLKIKQANPELPTGAKTYCKKWLKNKLYGRSKEIYSKYIEKGNACEEDGFTLMATQMKLGWVKKNEEFFSNEYIIGTPDLNLKPVIYDNKCAYDLDTFPMFDKVNPKDEYEDQIQGYMDLTGCTFGYIAYTLIDAPENLVFRELKWIEDHNAKYKKCMEMVFTKECFERMRIAYFYDSDLDCFIEIPAEKRIRWFKVERNDKFIKDVYQRVIMCRKYINEELLTIKNQ